jgi:hypothetical protein
MNRFVSGKIYSLILAARNTVEILRLVTVLWEGPLFRPIVNLIEKVNVWDKD